MKILTIDIGGTGVKILATGETEPRKFPSGPTLTPPEMVAGVKELAVGWTYDAISIGYPGVITHERIVNEPHNLGYGWRDFDFAAAFDCPVKLINDAAMQALGSYEGGLLLFLGLGTGLGSALVADGVVVPMELAHLSYRNATFEDYIGLRGIERLGKKKWRRHVDLVLRRFIDAFIPNEVVLGGGNAKKLKELPPGCRLGSNAYAFVGGFRLWLPTADRLSLRPEETIPPIKSEPVQDAQQTSEQDNALAPTTE